MKKHLWLVVLWAAAIASAHAQTKYRVILISQTNIPFADVRDASFGSAVGCRYEGSGDKGQAVLWTEQSALIVLHPLGFTSSSADGMSADCQVGLGYPNVAGAESHALLWRGGKETVVDLHPSGYSASSARFVYGDTQVGYGLNRKLESHALLWRGTAASVVDLTPADYDSTEAAAICGPWQVGRGHRASYPTEYVRALRWQGSPESLTDLHPTVFNGSRYDMSVANGVSYDGRAVGFGADNVNRPSSFEHALLWYGNATNFVDLHPPGFVRSVANAIFEDKQVGYGSISNGVGFARALVWKGTKESVVNLHTFLPPQFQAGSSIAVKLDPFGNILGTSYDPNSDVNMVSRQVLWIPDPDKGEVPTLKIAPWYCSGGQIRIQLMGEIGKTYRVERTTDFKQWVSVMRTNLAAYLAYVSELPGPSGERRFYRAVRE